MQQNEYNLLIAAYEKAEGDPSVFNDKNAAHLIIHKNKVLGQNLLEGLVVEPKETKDGVDVVLKVMKGVKIERPVQLCFGVLPKDGLQVINLDARLEEDSKIDITAHCIFPNAIKVRHQMQGRIRVGKGARYRYNEFHFHGEDGGVEVVPKIKVELDEGARFEAEFQLTKGRVGTLDIDYEVEAGKDSVTEMTAKAYGYGSDQIKIREKCDLKGEGSRAIIKSRVSVKGDAVSEVISEILASGKNARGHVDCVEIIQGNGRARAIPIVDVSEDTAKVTHEAAIGSVDNKQLETLMARGLTQDAAIDVIIKGMLK